MKKIYLSYGKEDRLDLEKVGPNFLYRINAESVDEIQGQDVLEKVPSLVNFIEECYRILKPGAKAIFSSQFYASRGAWVNPLTVRGISEHSLNFSDRTWREQTNFTDCEVNSNFEVQGSVAIDQSLMTRNEEVRAFFLDKYLNVAQAVLFTLIKRIDEQK